MHIESRHCVLRVWRRLREISRPAGNFDVRTLPGVSARLLRLDPYCVRRLHAVLDTRSLSPNRDPTGRSRADDALGRGQYSARRRYVRPAPATVRGVGLLARSAPTVSLASRARQRRVGPALPRGRMGGTRALAYLRHRCYRVASTVSIARSPMSTTSASNRSPPARSVAGVTHFHASPGASPAAGSSDRESASA